MSMTNEQKFYAARAKFEEALSEMMRLSYEDEGIDNMFVQDWVVCIAGESMSPGHENKTYLNNFCRAGMANYQICGLLDSAKRRFQGQ